MQKSPSRNLPIQQPCAFMFQYCIHMWKIPTTHRPVLVLAKGILLRHNYQRLLRKPFPYALVGKPLSSHQLHQSVNVQALILRHCDKAKRLENSQSLMELYFAMSAILMLFSVARQKISCNCLPVEKSHKKKQLARNRILLLDQLERDHPCLRNRTRRIRVPTHRLKLLAEQINEITVRAVQELKVLADCHAVLLDKSRRLYQCKR